MTDGAHDWGERVGDIVDGWLFSPQGDLPATLIVPLDNPHLHDHQLWADVFGAPMRERGVVSEHTVMGDCSVGVAKPVLGASATAMLVDAATRRGVRRFIGLGFCGGTQPNLRCGDVVATSAARADDGVAYRYLPANERRELPYIKSPGALIDAVGPRAARGAVHSVAAVHLEDESLVKACQDEGILGIDMETAALYAVAHIRSVEAITLLTVSDVPATGDAAEPTSLSAGEREALHQALWLATA